MSLDVTDDQSTLVVAWRHRAITWANVNPDLRRHMVSLGHNELMSRWYMHFNWANECDMNNMQEKMIVYELQSIICKTMWSTYYNIHFRFPIFHTLRFDGKHQLPIQSGIGYKEYSIYWPWQEIIL